MTAYISCFRQTDEEVASKVAEWTMAGDCRMLNRGPVAKLSPGPLPAKWQHNRSE